MPLIERKKYLDEALRFRDTDLVKVVTGIRRCGKSSLLSLLAERLFTEGIPRKNIIELNLESLAVNITTYDDLYAQVKKRIPPQGKSYVFIDEVQNVPGWEKAVNAMRVDFDCDLYVTGSNAYLLSSELATYLSGRYVEIKMTPLVFSEYLDFCGLQPASLPGQAGLLFDDKGEAYRLDTLFSSFRRYGGMPAIASLSTDQEVHSAYMQTLYDSVVTRDVIDRERDRSRRTITQPEVLQRICLYLADNIGNPCSINKIQQALKSFGYSMGAHTVDAYIHALLDAYVFCLVKRFDIRGKEHLKTLGKYYIADSGLSNYLLGYRDINQGRVLENLVYLQLKYEGFAISTGKFYEKEVDFVAIKNDRRIYVQVTHSLQDDQTKSRELTPLLSIKDGFEKLIIVGEGSCPTNIDGIRIRNASECFLTSIAAKPVQILQDHAATDTLM